MQAVSFSFKTIDTNLVHALTKIIAHELKQFEFSGFLLGMRFPSSFSDDEKALLKKELQFTLIQEVEKALKITADFENPDTTITVDCATRTISFYLKPLYIYGVYKKFSRNLAQTVYYCIRCKGRGCVECNGTGTRGKKSVQELIAKPLMKAFMARDNKFHGAGREDVDVRMLGNGREFVLELTDPKKRKANLKKLQSKINKKIGKKVKVGKLCFTEKFCVKKIKSSKHDKVYEAIVSCTKEIKKKELKDLDKKEFLLEQRTPCRVAKRRADLVRERTIKIKKIKVLSKKRFSVTIRAQTGTYVKEFISGDNERTRPSLSSLLEKSCSCKELDVVNIIR